MYDGWLMRKFRGVRGEVAVAVCGCRCSDVS